MNYTKTLLNQLKAELLHDIKKYEEEVENIKNEIPRAFSRGMLGYAKNMLRRIDYELKINHKQTEDRNSADSDYAKSYPENVGYK